MFRYLKAAFLFSPPVGPLGKIPLNLLLLAGCTILGIVRPEFLLLGMGLEAAYLYSLASNKRFQRLVDSVEAKFEVEDSVQRRQNMVERLKSGSRTRFAAQDEKCRRVLESYRDSSAPELLVSENGKALDKLQCAYAALLLNRDKLEALRAQSKTADLQRQVASAEAELAQPKLAETVRASKFATLEILRKREENLVLCEHSLTEIDSALARIEAQLDLALENAMMPERQYTIAADIEVASELLDEKGYSEMSAAIAEIDRSRGADRIRAG